MRHRTDATRWAIVYYGGSCCLFLLFPLARCHGSLDSSPVTAKAAAAAACIDSGRWFAATLPYLTLPQSLSHSRYPRDSLSASPASFYVPLSQSPSVSPDSCTLLAHSLLCSLHPHVTVLPSDHFTLKSAPSPRASLFNFSTTPNSPHLHSHASNVYHIRPYIRKQTRTLASRPGSPTSRQRTLSFPLSPASGSCSTWELRSCRRVEKCLHPGCAPGHRTRPRTSHRGVPPFLGVELPPLLEPSRELPSVPAATSRLLVPAVSVRFCMVFFTRRSSSFLSS